MLKHISRSRVLRLVGLVTTVCFAVVATGCYNTYQFEREEFAKLQRSDQSVVVVTSKANRSVAVDANTALYVRSHKGKRFEVTPFNFKLTESQLVASDRDTLEMVADLKSYEVDHLSTWQTVLLITGGAAAVAGVIVGVIYSAGQNTKLD